MNTLVVFLHGALSSAKSWNYLLYYNRRSFRQGDMLSVCFEYDIAEEKADDIVTNLLEQIDPMLLGVTSLKIIGHSFGGVLAIEVARRLIDAQLIHSTDVEVMTLSSPMGGSGAASFLKLFKPTSKFYQNVGAYDSFMLKFRNRGLPCKTKSIITSSPAGGADFLTGDNDGVVTVESQSQFLGDPSLTVVKMEVNHFEVLLCPDVGVEIAKFLHPSAVMIKFKQDPKTGAYVRE